MSDQILVSDCLDAMRAMSDGSVTAIVTDPPYGLEFMGKGWDKVLPPTEVWREALRVLRPGGHALIFGGTRTYHRLACAVEDAGFEIRDCLMWLYGQGFPKSLDVSKAIDRRRDDTEDVRHVCRWIRAEMVTQAVTAKDIADRFGFHSRMVDHWAARDTDSQPTVPRLDQVPLLLEALGNPEVPEDIALLLWTLNGRKGQPGEAWARREVVGTTSSTRLAVAPGQGEDRPRVSLDITAPATDLARLWSGYGTALKPAWEPIILARKPLVGTVAANALEHGTGALNIDGCRISGNIEEMKGRSGTSEVPGGDTTSFRAHNAEGGVWEPNNNGRWPANIILDEEAAALLDEQAPKTGQAAPLKETGRDRPGHGRLGEMGPPVACEPHDGLGGASRFFYCAKASKRDRGEGNSHPTVKPVELMRWLVRLVKGPGENLILDPFAGSGTTGVAAALEGVPCVLVEREAQYAEIIRRRLASLGVVP